MRYRSRQETLEAIRKRDGFLCYLCNGAFTDAKPPTIDHVMPLSRGGTWALDNLKLAHKSCNIRKGNRIFIDGKLEPIKEKETYAQRRQRRRSVLSRLCQTCHNGRRLGAQERCKKCGAEPGGTLVPKHLWRDPSACDHDTCACWICLVGLINRSRPIEALIR